MKIKDGIKAGLLFGVCMIFPYMFIFIPQFGISKGAIVGILTGCASGLLFGLAVYLFANSKIIKKQTALSPENLLEGEYVKLIEPANLVIKPKDFDLKKFAYDGLLWTVGMKNKEALGGKLYITNYRIILKTHKYNRLRGMISIFLPTIKSTKSAIFLIS